MRNILLLFTFLMVGAIQLSAQKNISSGFVRTEIKDNYTIYWQKNSSEKKLKLLDGNYRINYTSEYTIGTFEKGIPIDTLRHYLKEGNVLQQEHVFDKQGLKHGRQLTYHSNGQQASEGMFIHGKVDGIYREWHENGNRKLVVEVNNGTEDGQYTTWNKEGKILSEWQYKDRMRDGKCLTWIYNNELETFLNEEYYKNDQLVDTTYFYRIDKDGKRVLRARTVHDENNAVQSHDSYDGDVYFRMDYEKGNVKLMTQYTRGKLSARVEYKNGIQHGKSVCYYPGSTQLWKDETYCNGELISLKEYGIDGKLVRSKEARPEEMEAE